jgi:FMN phosphatase YigB (HAD superfamily)
MIIKIDTDEIVKLKEDGKKFYFEQASEEAIAQLLELQALLESAVDEVKRHVAEQGTSLNENFTGIRGDKVRVMYRFYGSPYAIDKTRIADMDDKYYARSITYRPNTKEVEAYAKEHKQLPLGILTNERQKQVSVSYVAADPEELEQPDES